MSVKMSQLPVNRVFFDSSSPEEEGQYEFTIDCGAVYFGAVYDDDGTLMTIDQYFFTETFSRDDLDDAIQEHQLLFVDDSDFAAKTYLLIKHIDGNEWTRFHAVVPEAINPDYFHEKYIGE
jgi:hypothetical protein